MSSFLYRQKHDDSNPYDIIPISINMHNILYERYFNLGLMDKYLIQTQSQTKSSGIILPEVHGGKENFKYKFTTSKAEKQPLRLKRVLKLNQD